MATIVYQGLHTCLESQLAESRTLRLKLSSSKPHYSFYQSMESLDSKPCFLDSMFYNKGVSEYHKSHINDDETDKKKISHIANHSSSMNLDLNTSMEKQPIYVHPLDNKRSSLISLELCTENLGSETGSTEVVKDDDNMFPSSTSETNNNGSGCYPTRPPREQQQQSSCFRKAKASKLSGIPPPPLTTIRGSESVKITSHRHDGRLVMKAVQAPSMRTCFRAERSNGRLRLSFWDDYDDATDIADEMEDMRNDIVNHKDDAGEDEVDEKVCLDPNIDGNSLDHSNETAQAIGKSERLCRCKDDEQLYEKKELLNREAFWVAASS